MTKNTNTPILRFPEFKDNWVKKKIAEVAPLQRGFDLPVDNIKKGDYPVVFSNGILKYHNEFKVTGPGVVTGRSGTIGKVTFVEKDYWPHNTSLWVTNFNNNSPKFIFYFYSKYKLERFGTGSGVPTLNRNDIHIQKEFFPDLVEQTKIASFLTAIDDKLQALKKKKELLEQYKKGAMQQLFSQALRFKKDDGTNYPDWEEKKLGEVCDVKKGKQLNKEELTETGDYPCINGGINPSGYTNKYNTKENTITISEGGNSCGYVNFFNVKFWSGGHNYSIEIGNPTLVVNKYLYQLLKFNENELMKLRVGSGLPNIQKKDLVSFVLNFTQSPEEQTKIANFLSSIDDKIAHCQSELDGMERWKKGLLQQLFC